MLEFDIIGCKFMVQVVYFDFRYVEEYVGNLVEVLFDFLLKVVCKGGMFQAWVEFDLFFFYCFDIEWVLDNFVGLVGDFYQLSYNLNFVEVDCVIWINFSDVDVDEWEDSSQEYYMEQVVIGYNMECDMSGNIYEVFVYEEVLGIVFYIMYYK